MRRRGSRARPMGASHAPPPGLGRPRGERHVAPVVAPRGARPREALGGRLRCSAKTTTPLTSRSRRDVGWSGAASTPSARAATRDERVRGARRDPEWSGCRRACRRRRGRLRVRSTRHGLGRLARQARPRRRRRRCTGSSPRRTRRRPTKTRPSSTRAIVRADASEHLGHGPLAGSYRDRSLHALFFNQSSTASIRSKSSCRR